MKKNKYNIDCLKVGNPMFYLSSVLISILVSNCSDTIIKKKIVDMGYIYESKRVSKFSTISSFIIHLIPYLNLFSSAITGLVTAYAIKNENLIKKSVSCGKPAEVKYIYEKYYINDQDYKDAMILEGADKEVIDQEMKEIKKEKNNVTYGYTEDDYRLACAIIAANQMLFEIECNITLTNEEKQKLLRMYRNMYYKELNGNKKQNMKPIEKTLEISKSK